MNASIIDLTEVRRKRAEASMSAAREFASLPCTVCDCSTSATNVLGGMAVYVCDGGGSHPRAEWCTAGDGMIIADGRVRRFFTY